MYYKHLTSSNYISSFFSLKFTKSHYLLFDFRILVQWLKSALLSLLFFEKLSFERLKRVLDRKPFISSPEQPSQSQSSTPRPINDDNECNLLLTNSRLRSKTDELNNVLYDTVSPKEEVNQSLPVKFNELDVSLKNLAIHEIYLLDPIYDLLTQKILPLDELYLMLSNDTIESEIVTEIIENLEIPKC